MEVVWYNGWTKQMEAAYRAVMELKGKDQQKVIWELVASAPAETIEGIMEQLA